MLNEVELWKTTNTKNAISSHIWNLITRFNHVHASLREKYIYDETSQVQKILSKIILVVIYEIWLYVLVTKIPANK